MYLNCHTYFSLKYGSMSIKGLLEEASAKGIRQLALTDINNTSACLDFIRLAPSFNIKPVVGIDFRNGSDRLFIAIARNNEGFYEINRYLSLFLHSGKKIPPTAPSFHSAYVIYPYPKAPMDLNPHELVGIQVSELNKLAFDKRKYPPHQLVALHPVTFRNKKDFNAHRLLRAIDLNILLSQLPVSEEAEPGEIMHGYGMLEELFHDHPSIIEHSYRILNTCSISFDFGPESPHKNQCTYSGSEKRDFALIKKLAYEGISYRYSTATDAILDRIEKELRTIQEKSFTSYFLIAWKILKYARSKGFFYVGRGSGANSIVSYLLRITDVDPIELDLYFERFINLFRKNPPDFDIDFSWHEREDVTAFIFQRFKNVALLATYNTFQYRAVIRELGKVFGLPAEEIKALQANPHRADSMGKLVLKYSKLIQGFPNHLSVHAGGILISENPLHHYTATFLPPKGFATAQFDMHTAEDIGLCKFDILGQRGLAKVKDTLEIVKQNRGAIIDIHNIKKLKEDPRANELLQNADAIGCFYVESPAMRMLLKKLRVSNYLGLVAASSVIRPGVAQSGMMREYILRFRFRERREAAKKASPALYKLMPETFGVMVYQEDVIKVAHYFAGLSLAEADILRRGMSGKFRSRDEFKQVEKKFFANCKGKGYSTTMTNDVWRQIESFAGYAFAKGHSASYAVESYQCLYLKAYYPIEYLTSVLNNGGGFYSTQFYVHEAKMCGAAINLPCINSSNSACTVSGRTIYLGLSFIYALEGNIIAGILSERWQNGLFKDLRDFLKRIPIPLEQTCILIRSGAFQFSGMSKKELLWDAHFLIGKKKKTSPAKDLFDMEVKKFSFPQLWKHPLEDAFDEMELIGFPVSVSLFELAHNLPVKSLKAKDLVHHVGRQVTLTGYLVHVKNTQTKDGKSMHFGTFIDLDGHWIDTVHFPPVARRYPFQGKGYYRIKGKVVEEFDYLSIEIQQIERLPHKNMNEISEVIRSTETYLKSTSRRSL